MDNIKYQLKSLDEHEFKPEDRLFLDTNIWLWVFGRQIPQKAGDRKDPIFERGHAYRDAFKRIIEAESNIYIDSTVISEFTRVSLRKVVGAHIKNYRGKNKLKKAAKEIVENVERIMQIKNCRMLEYLLRQPCIDNILHEFAKGHADFNDVVIAMLCKNNGLILLTDDIDFRDQSIQIITANSKLLSIT